MGEALSGRVKDLTDEYRDGIEEMTEEPVAVGELIEPQRQLIAALIGGMPDRRSELLIGFECDEPDWSWMWGHPKRAASGIGVPNHGEEL